MDAMTDPSADAANPGSFESALEALGGIVARLESGSLGLSESIAAYERGVGLLRRLHEELAAVEARVDVLVRFDDEGRPVFAPAEEAAAESAQPAPSRPARGSSRGRARRLPGMDDAAEGP
jgi:exodeoxyribonuclease VII small subunit